ncbi:NlpC/P60 family protein [Streptomyces sp. TG1A-8]|uniref:C40 family peptidase n=1 Tax=Streptomyces sp. TG1A-8 TaxID=3051385 RepID=UPI00265C8B34|nr:C40 family peptidase [Streptomyces sp. TG1A-8]MDO0927095.1 NlpC/P60 family protein [Streptomyces sp. TG1A-8]
MGTDERGLFMAAVTVLCAATALAAPGTAFAAPAPTPAPAPAPTASAVPAAPVSDEDLEEVRTGLDRLYHDAAVATDAYNAAEEEVRKQSARIVALAGRIVEGQRQLERLEDQAGAAARAQYRTGGLPPTARYLLSDDPQRFMDGAGTVLNGERAAKKLIGRLTTAQEKLRRYSADASAQWKELEADRRARATAEKRIERQVAAAEELESRLEEKEKERLARLEQRAAHRAQTAWLGTGVLKGAGGRASAQGGQAVAFATAQLGKRYVWGAEGPDSFDCSGLTSRAWAGAGRPVPRTSQEQWKRLEHVGIADMRPGDLIVYFDDASHVGMYVGDGRIVHAPRPGRTVTFAGAGSMPILGVVRPDA